MERPGGGAPKGVTRTDNEHRRELEKSTLRFLVSPLESAFKSAVSTSARIMAKGCPSGREETGQASSKYVPENGKFLEGIIMRIECETRGRNLVVRLNGELDLLTADAFRQTVERALDRSGAKNLFLNLEGVTFIDSSGLGVILGRFKRISQISGRMGIIGPTPGVRPILELSGIFRIIPILESEAAISGARG